MKTKELKLIGYTKDKIPVYDRPKSHLHKGVLRYLPEVLSNFKSRNEEITVFSYTFPHAIGYSYCVRVNKNDKIYFKQRPHRKGLSKFVRNRHPEPSNMLTIVLRRFSDPEPYYIILTAYIGEPAPPEPWDVEAFKRDSRGFSIAQQESINFWSKHALIEET